MDTTIHIDDRPVRVRVSDRAVQALADRNEPLVAEMELYFSCLIRKRVVFRDGDTAEGATPAANGLAVRFRPVMTRHCGLDYEGDEPPITDFPIVKEAPFVPKWLTVDYRDGEWIGEFGYREAG